MSIYNTIHLSQEMFSNLTQAFLPIYFNLLDLITKC